MNIDFENDATFVTARAADESVVIRCNTRFTDLRDDENLDAFVARHGGPVACAEALKSFYRAATHI